MKFVYTKGVEKGIELLIAQTSKPDLVRNRFHLWQDDDAGADLGAFFDQEEEDGLNDRDFELIEAIDCIYNALLSAQSYYALRDEINSVKKTLRSFIDRP